MNLVSTEHQKHQYASTFHGTQDSLQDQIFCSHYPQRYEENKQWSEFYFHLETNGSNQQNVTIRTLLLERKMNFTLHLPMAFNRSISQISISPPRLPKPASSKYLGKGLNKILFLWFFPNMNFGLQSLPNKRVEAGMCPHITINSFLQI